MPEVTGDLRILYLEPFCGGSHAAFTRTLQAGIPAAWTSVVLPGRHWKWRMRGSAVFAALAEVDALTRPHDLLVASSYLPLAELVGLVPSLARIPKLLYFHENQLAYPVREARERDHHFAVTQMVSALCADRCVFNSRFNRDSFLRGAQELLGRMPDAVPPGWVERIAARSEVLPLPLPLPPDAPSPPTGPDPGGPLILWNHRREHDKDPDTFFAALFALAERGLPFRLALAGERYRQEPPVFEAARARLGGRIVFDGYCATAAAYWALLDRCDLALSTAAHEFFGVAMLEACHAGCFVLVPDDLAYPEHFPPEHRYAPGTLVERLAALLRAHRDGVPLRADRRVLTRPYAAERLLPRYAALFDRLARHRDPGPTARAP